MILTRGAFLMAETTGRKFLLRFKQEFQESVRLILLPSWVYMALAGIISTTQASTALGPVLTIFKK